MYNCSCAAGWEGLTCADNVDECASRPCQNAGVCVDGVDHWECECAPTFEGLDCSVDMLSAYDDGGRMCGPVLFFDMCDGACVTGVCVTRPAAALLIGESQHLPQSSSRILVFGTSMTISVQGTAPVASLAESALNLALDLDVGPAAFAANITGQRLSGTLQVPGKYTHYNRPEVEHCYTHPLATDYDGDLSTTRSGRTCQAWSRQQPHLHNWGALHADGNYCRNPDARASGAWCYTTDPARRSESCALGTPSVQCGVWVLRSQAVGAIASAIRVSVCRDLECDVSIASVEPADGSAGRRLQSEAEMLAVVFSVDSVAPLKDPEAESLMVALAAAANGISANSSDPSPTIYGSDIGYAFLNVVSTLAVEVEIEFDPDGRRPSVPSVLGTLANLEALTMALRAAARYRAVTAVAASVTDAGVPVLKSNVTVEHAVEFVLELFVDACGTDQAAQNLCVVPVPNASSGALQPIFRADLASVLGVSEDRVLLRATGTEAPSPLEVLVRIEPSSPAPGPIDHLGEPTTGDALRLLLDLLDSSSASELLANDLLSGRAWFSLLSRPLRLRYESLVVSAGANATNASLLNESAHFIDARDEAAGPGDGSWSDSPCRYLDGCADGEAGELVEEADGDDGGSGGNLTLTLSALASPLLVALACSQVSQCVSERRRKARVKHYDDTSDDEGTISPTSSGRSIRSLKHINPRRPFTRERQERRPSDVTSLGGSSTDEAPVLDPKSNIQLAPDEEVRAGGRVVVTAGETMLGRVGLCIREPVPSSSASVDDVPHAFREAALEAIAGLPDLLVQLIWEDTGNDSGYVRVSTLTAVKEPIRHRPRVHDLEELRENIGTRQQSRRQRRREMLRQAAAITEAATAASAASARPNPAGSGPVTPTPIPGAVQPTRSGRGAAPWWLERLSTPGGSDARPGLALPPLQSSAVARGARRRERDQRPKSRADRTKRGVAASGFRATTPLAERLDALIMEGLQKKVDLLESGAQPISEWPSALRKAHAVALSDESVQK